MTGVPSSFIRKFSCFWFSIGADTKHMNFPKSMKVQLAHMPRMMKNAYILTEVRSVMGESVLWMVCVSGPFHIFLSVCACVICSCIFLAASNFSLFETASKTQFVHTWHMHRPFVWLFLYAKDTGSRWCKMWNT